MTDLFFIKPRIDPCLRINQKPDRPTLDTAVCLCGMFRLPLPCSQLDWPFLVFISCIVYFKWIKKKDESPEIELLKTGRPIEFVVDNKNKINNATNDKDNTIRSASADITENHNSISAIDIEKAKDKIKQNVPIDEEGTHHPIGGKIKSP